MQAYFWRLAIVIKISSRALVCTQELATLDHALTGVSYSRLAVACLLVAESELKTGVNVCVVNSLRTVMSETELQGLLPSVERLYEMYKSVVAQQSQPVQQ